MKKNTVNQLEKEFLKAKELIQDKVQEKVNQINSLIEEVENLSEEAGIPVNFVFGLRYTPWSFHKKYNKIFDKFGRIIDENEYEKILEAMGSCQIPAPDYSAGWRSSSERC